MQSKYLKTESKASGQNQGKTPVVNIKVGQFRAIATCCDLAKCRSHLTEPLDLAQKPVVFEKMRHNDVSRKLENENISVTNYDGANNIFF